MNLRHLAPALMVVALAGTAWAEPETKPVNPPTSEPAKASDPIAEAVKAFQEEFKSAASSGTRPNEEQTKAMAARAFAKVDASTLTVAQLKTLANSRIISVLPSTFAKSVVARATTLAKTDDADGARAALLAIAVNPGPAGDSELLTAALAHPGLKAAINAPKGLRELAVFGNVDADSIAANAAGINALAKILPDDPAPNDAAMMIQSLEPALENTEPAKREDLRVKLLGIVSKAAEKTTEGDRAGKYLRDRAKYLDSQLVKVGLVNQPAPEIDFAWHSKKDGPKKLSDLKGKVVIVDFWATWCGPCIASFPKVAQLQERYKDLPVVIVGVTSPQGSGPRGARTAKGEPLNPESVDAEYAAMNEFMDAKKMTWNVAFSTQNVFNPEYGVNGIPHVVIIDAKGKVRHRGINPLSTDPEKEHEMIDALLKEAGLPTPGSNKN